MKHSAAFAVLLAGSLISFSPGLALAQESKTSDPPAPAARSVVDVSGVWKLTMEGRNGTTMERELVLTQKGEVVTGVLKPPASRPANTTGATGRTFRMREMTLEQGTMKGDTLTFVVSFQRPNGGTAVTRTYRATLKGDTLTGETQSAQGNPRPWKAVRVSSGATDLAGDWAFTINTPNGDFTTTYTFRKAAAGWQGEARGPQGNRMPLKSVALQGKALTFQLEIQAPNNTFKLDFAGNLEGDAIKGEFKSARGNIAATAKRVGGVVGEWELTITTPDRTYRPKLVLRREGDKLTGDLVGDDGGRMPLESASFENGRLKAVVNVPSPNGGSPLRVEISGAVTGDTMSGDCNTTMGNAPFTGKRTAQTS